MSRGKLFLSALPGLVVGLIWIWLASWESDGVRRFTLFDDSLISMTYGRTFAQTGELVWYPGAPRVEGITNPLWTGYMAFVHWIGFEDSSAAIIVSITGLAFVLSAAILAGMLANRLVENASWVVYSSVAATSLSFPALFWATRGMEVGLQLFLLMALIYLVEKLIDKESSNQSFMPFIFLAFVVVAGVWTRIDFIVLVAAIVIWLLVTMRMFLGHTSVILVLTGAAAIALISQTLWRVTYYGEFFPNTYFLKVEGHSLLDRLLRGQWTTGKIALIAALAILGATAIFIWQSSQQKRLAGLLSSVALAAVLYSTYVGGDAWDEYTFGNRYVTPVYVIGAILFLAGTHALNVRGFKWLPFILAVLVALVLLPLGIRGLSRGSIILGEEISDATSWALASGIVILTLLVLYFLLSKSEGPPHTKTKIVAVLLALLSSGSLSWVGVIESGGPKVSSDQWNAEFGLLLKNALPANTSIATVFAGAPIYYSKLPAYDLLGKSDSYIAKTQPKLGFKPGHDKYDYDYSIGVLQPDVIVDLFVPPPDMDKLLIGWGYEQRCFDTKKEGQQDLKFWMRTGSQAATESRPCNITEI